jgi:short-subunit dehydrogenase
VTFAAKYGTRALVAGASDGVGAAFAMGLAERGLNVVLLARRQAVLERVAQDIESRTSSLTRTLAVDLTESSAASAIAAATSDLDIGFLVYCAGADPDFTPFLANSVEAAEAMVHRNCMVPMQLCHHFARPMVDRGSGAIVIFGSGAGLAGGPNMVAYGASKAFDMVFAEALWAELHNKGVDVLGLILGKTDTPALRRLEYGRGQIGSPQEVPGCRNRGRCHRGGVRQPDQWPHLDGRRRHAGRRADAVVVAPQPGGRASRAGRRHGDGRRIARVRGSGTVRNRSPARRVVTKGDTVRRPGSQRRRNRWVAEVPTAGELA